MALWDKKVSTYNSPLKIGDVVKVRFDDGTEISRSDVDPNLECRSCHQRGYAAERIQNAAEYVQYFGLCRPCCAQQLFGVKGTLTDGMKFIWRRPVEVTSKTRSGIRNSYPGADMFGNDFGVGDIVRVAGTGKRSQKVRSDEGTVVQLHEYTGDYFGEYKRFLAKVLFQRDKIKGLISSNMLEALTCNAVIFDTSQFEGSLTDTKASFDPLKADTAEVRTACKDPVARAIWMSHRLNHLYTDGDHERVAGLAIIIAEELRKSSLPRERLHYWFKNKFNCSLGGSGFGMEDPQIAFLVPYLAGEREATYKVVKR